MIRNYILIAFRQLVRQKVYSVINIAGLAVGIAGCILILLFVVDELSFDRYHEKEARIYRLSAAVTSNGRTDRLAQTPGMWGPELQETFPEVEKSVRIYRYRSDIIVANPASDDRFYESNFFWADPAVLEIFTFPLIAGNPAQALAQPNSLVISRAMAAKYFGEHNPVGQTLTYTNQGTVFNLQVTGVMADVSANSHFRPEFIGSLSTYAPGTWHWKYGLPTSWTNCFYRTYLLLQEGSDFRETAQKISVFIHKHTGDEAEVYDPFLQPLADIHLHSNLIGEFNPNGDIEYVYIFAAVAFLILLVACINYMNLATARSLRRAKEIGLRKTMGGQRWQLLLQFYGESLLLVLLAVLAALPLVEIVLPLFNHLAERNFTLGRLWESAFFFYFLGMVFLVSLLSGSYPALILSGFRPVQALRGNAGQGVATNFFSGRRMRRALVILQFAAAVFLIAAAGIISRQMDFFQQNKWQLREAQIVNIPLRSEDTFRQVKVFQEQILQHEGILGAAACSHIPFTASKHGEFIIPELLGSETVLESDYIVSDAHFSDVFGLEVVAGRGFREDPGETAQTRSFLLNESAVSALGATNEQVIGMAIKHPFFEDAGKVVGVVKDFHYRSLHQSIGPLVIKTNANFVRFLSVKIAGQNLPTHLNTLRQQWTAMFPDVPFVYSLLDADVQRLYRAEEKVGQLFRYFSAIAILISCLGLFGLTAFAAEQRRKEIGIRKVVGASVLQVAMLFSKDFMTLILCAYLIAIPLAFLALREWLSNFPYHVNIGWETFLLSGCLVSVVALLTVSIQAVKTARANPVNALRSE